MPSRFNVVRASIYGKMSSRRQSHLLTLHLSSCRPPLDRDLPGYRSTLPEFTCHQRYQ